jgi:outer membrane protein assembly factor BamD
MRKPAFPLILLSLLLVSQSCEAYWVWSPETGKWVNPKKTAKDTPEDQLAWAMEFYNNKEWDRAIEEFEKLSSVYPNSRLAAEAVYFSGLSWEEKGDIAKAADAHQKLIDRYPYSDRIKDAVKREFEIAGQFASGAKIKVLGVPMLYGQDKALELYKHIVRNAPFGTYGDQAQYKIGELYTSRGEFDEARKAFQALVDDYPNSVLIPKAKYEIARVSMEASRSAAYNEQEAQRAIEEFQGFKKDFPEDQQSLMADEQIQLLRREKARVAFETAGFYERQKKWKSAKVYYQEVALLIGIHQPGHHMAKEVGQVFGEISEDEHRGGRPMLSAIAIALRGYPGPGFFTLATQLGKYSVERGQDKLGFWRSGRDQVFRAWAEE